MVKSYIFAEIFWNTECMATIKENDVENVVEEMIPPINIMFKKFKMGTNLIFCDFFKYSKEMKTTNI